mmetsp:Transcript_18662/g.37145  ORF Transcript_18662/g.37145 Transcript_18662/m.37145 type:complete len:331 (+) Transcript_18662:109-1101(+)
MKFRRPSQLSSWLLLALCCLCGKTATNHHLGVEAKPGRSAPQDKNGYHVNKRNKNRKAITGQTFTKSFKEWTHDEDGGKVDVDEVAEKKQSRRQRYAALGRASFFFLTKYGPQGEVCLSAAVPEDRIVHIAYHIPGLLEEIEIPDSGSDIAISVQEHMLEEDHLSMKDDDDGYRMDDDYSLSMKRGSFPVETFSIFRKIGTIHHETDMGGSIEVCVTASPLRHPKQKKVILPMLVGVDITTGKEHHDDDAMDLEDEMDDALVQLDECYSSLRNLNKLMQRSKKVEAITLQDADRRHKLAIRWPMIQIVVLLVTGAVWAVSITQYLNRKLF